MPLEVDFIETFASGVDTGDAFDTVTLEVKVGAGYVGAVSSYDITNLSFNSATADFISISHGPGLTIQPNASPGTLNFAGFVTGPDVSAGAVLATIVFHLTSGANTVPLTNITGDLNSDPESSHADVPCFAAGTLISTGRGDVPVETL